MRRPIVVRKGKRCSLLLVALTVWVAGLAAAVPAAANQASIWASLSNNWVAGEGFAADTSGVITITDEAEQPKSSGVAQTDGDGRFFAQTNTIGDIDLVPGDTIEVSVGPVTRTLVLEGPLSFDLASDPRQPFGALPQGATVDVYVFGSDCSASTSIGDDNNDGRWSADFSSVCQNGLGVDPHGNAVLVDGDGDRTIAEPASLRASLTRNWIRGQAFESYGQVDIRINSVLVTEVGVDATGNFFVALEHDLVAGDTVEAYDGTTIRTLIVGGPLTAAVDTVAALASGLLPTSARIRVDVAGSLCGASRVVRDGDDGSIDGVWSADFSEECPAGLGTAPGINQWGFEAFGQAVLFDADVDATVAEAGAKVEITSAPGEPMPVGAGITVEGVFTHGAHSGPHIANWDWGDGSTSTGVVSEVDGSGSVGGDHIYGAPGVYSLRLTVTNGFGVASTDVHQFVVIYGFDGGFVTGGGWIDSPQGSYAFDASLQGIAHFGFVSKYKNGATIPTGKTEFQFRAGDMDFHSDSYEWLVVTGQGKAKYKGVGAINGSGSYGFMLTACDAAATGNCNGQGADTFRIKIWDQDESDAVVYDNVMGASDDSNDGTAIGGGSIVIHRAPNDGCKDPSGCAVFGPDDPITIGAALALEIGLGELQGAQLAPLPARRALRPTFGDHRGG